ncbi:pilus assembly protein TadG-related protein [Thalassoglobus sp. JC818]|uniref:pilus assembly protein TadG-related protein n=1 Tax=Thalassoglobus sp. JC818 TaxID=3232136 RepID=UPI00345858AD
MKTLQRTRFRSSFQNDRKGAVLVMGIGLLVILFAFTALALDMGYISLSRAELQRSADAAALAANIELYKSWGVGASKTNAQGAAAARTAAVAVAAANEAAGRSGTYIDSANDIRFGYRQWDPAAGQWSIQWGQAPYNAVEVTARRNNPGSNLGDGPLDLWFAPVIGSRNATTTVKATAAIQPGVTIRNVPNIKAGILPITLDEPTWDNLVLNGAGSDNYHWNDDTKTITSGSDGILEVSLYPYGNQALPPGNRGTVDFGHQGNSTADISRQILHGLNDSDLSYFGGQLDLNALPMILNGDTGLSAGIKDELEAIKGEPRMIPIFSQVSGNGNNANYTIVKFVPIRIMYVKLTGKPSGKTVVIQPAVYTDPSVVGGDTVILEDSVLAPAGLIH